MSSRRVPLNALASNVASPFGNSNSSTTIPSKRQIRTQSTKDSVYGQPPAKRQILEADVQQSREREARNALAKTVLRTPSKQVTPQDAARRELAIQPTALQTGSRVKPRTRTGDPPPSFQLDQLKPKGGIVKKSHPETNAEAVETIRVWQRHYRKAFPNYVFYFESVPDECRSRFVKQVKELQSRVEPFFSKEITHVITMRAVPSKSGATAKALQPARRGSKEPTVNPQALDKAADATSKRSSSSSTDVLRRALDYEMKIWDCEKFDRILSTILDHPIPQKASQSQSGHTVSHIRNREHRVDSLARALRQEKLHGPMDRDPLAATNDMVYFQGPYIMVADMTKIHRPILMREYPKAANKDEITWPRFRSTGHGRCPWLEDPNKKAAKKEAEERKRHQPVDDSKPAVDDFLQKEKALKEALRKQETEKLQRELEKADKILRKFREPGAQKGAAKISTNMSPPPRRMSATVERSKASGDLGELMKEITGPRKAASFSISNSARNENDIHAQTQPSFSITQKESSRVKATTTDRNFPPRAHIETSGDERPQRVSRMYEPVASGLQISTTTSAIRSQVISSNALQAGSKAGTNKDMFTLKRKVFEKTNGNAESARVSAAQPKLERATTVPLKRVSSTIEDKENIFNKRSKVVSQRVGAVAPAAEKKAAATPGYCENCREKFEDFDEHVQSRKHRRFAEEDSNFAELDDLLSMLERPERKRWYSP